MSLIMIDSKIKWNIRDEHSKDQVHGRGLCSECRPQEQEHSSSISVVAGVAIAVMKHRDQRHCGGEKGLFGLHFHIVFYHGRKSGQELNTTETCRQKLMQKPWRSAAS